MSSSLTVGMQETKGWIKCQSKSRPGRSYLFNRATGETKWCSESKSTEGADKTPPAPKPMSAYQEEALVVKTPAQDRLKRLQSKLKKDHKERNCRERNNNCTAAQILLNADKAGKTAQPARRNTTVHGQNVKPDKRIGAAQHPPDLTKRKKNESSTLETHPSCSSHGATNTNATATPTSTATATPTTSSSGVASKYKHSSKNSKIAELGAKKSTDELHKSLKQPNKRKSRPDKQLLKPFAVQDAVREMKMPKTRESVLSASPPSTASKWDSSKEAAKSDKANLLNIREKNLCIPTYQKGSANSRLEKLRKSLAKNASSRRLAPSYDSTPLKSTYLDSPRANSLSLSAEDSNLSADLNFEPMDWQSVDEQLEPPQFDKSASLSDNYCTVNENLLRLSAEKAKALQTDNQKWSTHHYHFVLDTNVLLRHLTFIDDLSKMRLCETDGTILYIPYRVLQELDKLKIRNTSEGTKIMAARAIKYLNEHLEADSMRAQSAVDERVHLIDVTSPDDSIINCCLQVKQHVDNVILLTEDVNLRNKALCNDILVSTKSDLVSLHATSATINNR